MTWLGWHFSAAAAFSCASISFAIFDCFIRPMIAASVNSGSISFGTRAFAISVANHCSSQVRPLPRLRYRYNQTDRRPCGGLQLEPEPEPESRRRGAGGGAEA